MREGIREVTGWENEGFGRGGVGKIGGWAGKSLRGVGLGRGKVGKNGRGLAERGGAHFLGLVGSRLLRGFGGS